MSLEFLALALVEALAGICLAPCADQNAEITRLGRLLIGSVLLAAANSLPELTVDLLVIRQGMPDLATGDLDGAHPSSGFVDISPTHTVTELAWLLATALAIMGQLHHVEKRQRNFEADALLMLLILGVAMFFLYRLSL